VWDGITEWYPPPNSEAIRINEEEWCDIGFNYDPTTTTRFTPQTEVIDG
jgi:hypothetical protein